MKPHIIPTILVRTAHEAEERLKLLGHTARWIQWDIMDGSLTGTQSWADPTIIKHWRTLPNIELHLMVTNPAPFIQSWKKITTVKRVIWHIEAPIDHAKLLTSCRRQKLETVLAISPGTPLATLIPFLRSVDGVLVLGVIPGKNGSVFIPDTLKTIRQLKRLTTRLPIGCDGGINSKNLLQLKRAGVTRFNMGSGIFQSTDPLRTLKQFQKRLDDSTLTHSRTYQK